MPKQTDVTDKEWAHEPFNREVAAVQSILDEFLASRESVRMLDAGCGSQGYLRIPAGIHAVGIDISQRQLERNQQVSERILGDLQTYPLPETSFDLVVCWDVLEHLPDPEAALCNMQRALKLDGLMILGMPNLMSVKGLITKFTPHAFHVWFYRHVLGSQTAGQGDVGPFPTFFRLAMSPKRVRQFAEASGLRVEHFALLESSVQRLARLRYHVTGRLWNAIRFAVKCVTIGMIDPEKTDLVIVLGGPGLGNDQSPIPKRRPIPLRSRP